MLTRREFSRCFLAGGTAFLSSDDLWATGKPQASSSQGSIQDCDLLVKGGTVVDPGQQLHGPFDVAVKDEKFSRFPVIFPRLELSGLFQLRTGLLLQGSLIFMFIVSTE